MLTKLTVIISEYIYISNHLVYTLILCNAILYVNKTRKKRRAVIIRIKDVNSKKKVPL